jgi:probable F420-dependent oxidoreductase
MRFSLMAPVWRDLSDSKPFRQTFELVRIADALGYDTVTQGHHHFMMGNLSDPLTYLAALAGITEKIRFSTTIFLLPFHNPLRVAEQVAMIDQLSGGRAGIGVGTGWNRLEYEAYGVPFAERGPRMEEALKVMRLLWTEEKVEFHGQFNSFPRLTLYPRPIQKPNPPLWVAGGARVAIERAARLGDAWLCGPVESSNRILAMKAIYDAKCAALSRQPDWVLRRYVWISEEPGTIERDVLPGYIEGLLGHWRESTTDPENIEIIRRIDAGGAIPTRQIADDRLLWGDPASIIRQIRELRDRTGLDHLIVAFGTGLPAHNDLNGRAIAGFDEVARMVRLFAQEVMPAFKT